MADNFDLRQFLTENKLTKNAQLLNEARVEGFDVNKKAFKVSFINKYGGEGDSRILNAETPEQAEEIFTNIFVKNPDMVKSIKSIEPYQVPAPKPQAQPQPGLEGVDYGSIEIDGVDSNDYPDFVDAYVAYAEFEDGTPLSEEELFQLTDELYQSGELADRAAESLYEGREKGTLDEALNKDIKAFGQDLGKYLTNAGFKVKYVNGRISDEDMKQVKTNTGLIALEPDQNEHQQSLFMYFNPKEVGKVEKIVNKFQLTPYSGRILARGWTAKQVQGALNPGDIYKYEDKPRGAYYFYRLAKVDRKVKDINEASYKVSKNSKEAQHLKKGDIIGSGEEVVSVSAGAKTPSGKVEVTLKTKDGKTKTSTWGKTTKVGVKEKETVKENKMTNREKYLTRLVENALGLQVTEDDNVDYTMGRQDDPNQLPNPAPELNIPEGDEMADETVIPEYNTIEELMKQIDKGTNRVAEEHKVLEMKKIAKALRGEAQRMEESEHAKHINPKVRKKYLQDAIKIEKAAEKLVAALEKEAKNTKPASTPKAEKVEALQENNNKNTMENFDLKKFLIENKLTSNSRMLNENFNDQTSAIEKFINEPLLGGYFINTIEGPMHSIDLQIATEPDNHEGKKFTDFEILGTARYYPNEKWEFRNGGQPIKSGKMPKLASKTPADDKLLTIIAAEIDRATPAAQ